MVRRLRAHATGRWWARWWPASYVVLVALCFAYFYPIYAGQVIPYESW